MGCYYFAEIPLLATVSSGNGVSDFRKFPPFQTEIDMVFDF